MGYPEDDPQSPNHVAAFQRGLRQVGLDPERNVLIDYRWAGIDPDRARLLSRELIALRPSLIVASTNQVVSILMGETKTIPIVFVFIGDPIGSRYAASFAEPGSNLTGFSNFETRDALAGDAQGDRTDHEARRLYPSPGRFSARGVSECGHRRGANISLQLTSVPVTSAAEIQNHVSAFGRAGPHGGIVVAPHALTLGSGALLTALAAQHQLPAIYGDRHFMRAGGLLCFGINMADQLQRAGAYVDRILKGQKAEPACRCSFQPSTTW